MALPNGGQLSGRVHPRDLHGVCPGCLLLGGAPGGVNVMKLSAKVMLMIIESEMIMLSKAFRLLAVELAEASPGAVEPALNAVLEMVAADLAAIAQKFPKGITPDHPFQALVQEARDDIAKAAKPH